MAQRQQADLGRNLEAFEAARLLLKPFAGAIAAPSRTSSGACYFPVGSKRRRWQPTRNHWSLGWCKRTKAWAAYGWTPGAKGHRGKVFRTRAGLEAYADFLSRRNWEVSYV